MTIIFSGNIDDLLELLNFHYIDHIRFSQLAQISRSTRGVVLLLCSIDVARKVMHEAQRLNMIGGHFIWIWADTSSTTEFYNAAYHDISEVIKDTKDLLDRSEYLSKKTDTGSDSTYDRIRELLERKMDFDEMSPRRKNTENSDKLPSRIGLNLNMNLSEDDKSVIGKRKKRDIEIDDSLNQKSNESIDNFFINNLNSDLNLDDYLVDNNNNNVDIDVKSKRKSNNKPSNDTSSYVLFHHFVDFPVGLLALRPVHMKLDRNFIRSAVRLFASSWAKIENEMKSTSNRDRQRTGSGASSSSMNGNRNKFNQKFKRNAQNQLHGHDAVIVNKYQKSKIIKNSTFQVNSSFLKSSDLTNNNNNKVINSSFNQILSGLNEYSNNMSNKNKQTKVKRDILSKNVNKRRGSWWQVMNVTDARDYQLSNRRTPRYRGGCYGSQKNEEIVSAEYFAR